MDKETSMFTSPAFYKYAVQGLIEEGVRRIQEREPVSDIEQWVGVCDQLAGASHAEISEVISSLLEVSAWPVEVVDPREELRHEDENASSGVSHETSSGSESDLESLETQTAPSTVIPMSAQPSIQSQFSQQSQDPFGLPSFSHMGGDIFADLSEELGVNLDTETGE